MGYLLTHDGAPCCTAVTERGDGGRPGPPGPAPGVAAGARRRPPARECGTTRPVTFALGVLMFPTDRAMRPDELAREAEGAASSRSGSPSTPTSRSAAHAVARRRAAPEQYRRTLDPFVALAAAAAVTSG